MKSILRPSKDGSFVADALRDLIVVVVSILAALWLESWWQDRQSRAEETLLLAGLRTEFVANRAQLVEKIAVWAGIVEAAEIAHRLMRKPLDEAAIAEAQTALVDISLMSFFDPRQGQLSSLISSGKLGLVHSPGLRAKIADWPSLVADLDLERAIALHDITDGYFAYMTLYGDINWNDGTFDTEYQEIFTSRELDNLIGGLRTNMQRSISEGNVILQATDEIIALIDDELRG